MICGQELEFGQVLGEWFFSKWLRSLGGGWYTLVDGLIWGAQDDFIIKNGTLMEVAARLSSPTMADQRINMWLLQHGSLKVVETYVET